VTHPRWMALCSALDTSGNRATARFLVTVRRGCGRPGRAEVSTSWRNAAPDLGTLTRLLRPACLTRRRCAPHSGGGEVLRIGTARQKDAECVADALHEYSPEVEHDEVDWAVVISAPSEGAMVTDLLSALKQCLDEQEIPSVKVTIAERSYVMEGMT
jgi:hypothetical protein